MLAPSVAEALSYVCGWVGFPIAAIFLTRLLGLSARYVPLVVADNWSAVVQMVLYATVVLVGTLLPPQLRALALLVATLIVLIYQWFVIRTALGTSGGTALGLVVIDVLLSMALSRRPRRAPAAGLGGWPRPAYSAATRNSPSAGAVCRRAPGRAPPAPRAHARSAPALAHRLQRADDVAHLMVQEGARPRRHSISSPAALDMQPPSVLTGELAWHSLAAEAGEVVAADAAACAAACIALGIERHRHVPDAAALQRRAGCGG